jgi:putative DNA-invertase from lambdoid prophage Rac
MARSNAARIEPVGEPMRTYGYVRVSTSRQAEEGLSLDEQERRIRGRAMELGTEIDRCFVERGVSAGTFMLAERPEGKKLLGHLMPGDLVISPKLDRMFRNAEDALATVRRFKERRVRLVLLDIGGEVTENGNGLAKMFFTIVAAFAEWERHRLRERVQASKDYGKSEGLYLGGICPYGYQVTTREDGTKVVEPDPAEQAIIAKIRAGYPAEGTHKLARRFGLSTSTVHKILKNK